MDSAMFMVALVCFLLAIITYVHEKSKSKKQATQDLESSDVDFDTETPLTTKSGKKSGKQRKAIKPSKTAKTAKTTKPSKAAKKQTKSATMSTDYNIDQPMDTGEFEITAEQMEGFEFPESKEEKPIQHKSFSSTHSVSKKLKTTDKKSSESESHVQIRKRRGTAEETVAEKEKPIFEFTSGFDDNTDPTKGDNKSNKQLEALLGDDFNPGNLNDLMTSNDEQLNDENIAFRFIDDNADDSDDDDKETKQTAESEESVKQTTAKSVKESMTDQTVTESEKGLAKQMAVESVRESVTDQMATESVKKPVTTPIVMHDTFQNILFKQRISAYSILDRFPESIEPEYDGESVEIIFYNKHVKNPTKDDHGMVALYNGNVYDGDKPKLWDTVFEVRVTKNQTVQVDLGIGMFLPEGCALQIVENSELLSKFGLRMKSQPIIQRKEAAFPIILEFEGCTYTSYIAKNQPLVSCRVVKLASA